MSCDLGLSRKQPSTTHSASISGKRRQGQHIHPVQDHHRSHHLTGYRPCPSTIRPTSFWGCPPSPISFHLRSHGMCFLVLWVKDGRDSWRNSASRVKEVCKTSPWFRHDRCRGTEWLVPLAQQNPTTTRLLPE